MAVVEMAMEVEDVLVPLLSANSVNYIYYG